ncbi:MAG TPA: hypothetical protein VK766_08645, partial [Cytophagaceae bacterium]|nr:hypothetical protein [Cytophagaceae bacterium]
MMEKENQGLYDPAFEKDACGIGFVANLKGRKSHDIIDKALTMLEHMEHRGACGCESTTGDGAGILIQVPHEFFVDECLKISIKLPAFGNYGVGIVFFPKDEKLREECRDILNSNIEKLGMKLLGYRKVPTVQGDVGPSALAVEPVMEQLFIKRADNVTDLDEFERKLFVFRNYSTRIIRETYHLQFPDINNLFHIVSLSYKTIIYKGQFTTWQVRQYFPDLQQKQNVSALAVVHSRFSTNTFPAFRLAQPFRYIAHNGEINTLRGNLNWMMAQEASLESDYFSKEEMEMVLPLCDPTASDSANLDNAIELLTLSGRSLAHVMMMLVPEAWDGNKDMSESKRAFYEYHAALIEPWDGPASISFTDGKIVGATLDRNGLR